MIRNRSNNNGFTLVELLAVIVILAVILAISIPSIGKLIDGSTRSAFENDARMLLKQLEYEQLKDNSLDITTIDHATITDYKISNANYDNLKVKMEGHNPYIVVVGKGKWKGLTACGTRNNMIVVKSTDIETCSNTVVLQYDEIKKVNKPQLAMGMTPVVYNTETSTWDTISKDNTDWYDYDNKKWANARTKDGSLWVWIPRYAYKITHGGTTGTIDVKFLKENTNITEDGTTIETSGYVVNVKDTSMHYFLHPAFQFGGEQLGIWVAKFETSNDGNNNIKSIPNATSWREINISTMFSYSQSMKDKKSIYGWNSNEIDTHLMKNTEWGSVAYLSKSKYGADEEEIWNNAYNGYKTGCSGTIVDAADENTCITYETVNGQKASTTHNIYGVYDMSGGAWEYVMGNYDNLKSSSGFTDLSTIDGKYIDKYSGAGNYDATRYGDAVYETGGSISGSTGWFGDFSGIPIASSPWFIRGGRWINDSLAGPFSFYDTDGDVFSGGGFRVVLVVNYGL